MKTVADPAFVRFRESHHAIARMFAAGWTISKVSHETGYTRRRLHILLSDPSFQELIVQKAKTLEEKIDDGMDHFFEVHYGNTMMAARRLNERLAELEEADEHLPVRDYVAIIKDGADRFGYGAKSTRVNINVDFASALDRAIERSSTIKTIEAHSGPTLSVGQPPTQRRSVGPRLVEKQEALDPHRLVALPASPVQVVAPARPAPSFERLLRRSL